MASQRPVSDSTPFRLSSAERVRIGVTDDTENQIETREYTSVPKFIEKRTGTKDEDEYSRNGSDPGLVIIFNQQTFDSNHDPRIGTNRDVNELIVTFGRLGYNIQKHNVHNDKTRRQVLEVIKQLSTEDHSDKNSLIVVVLTHGDTNNVLYVRDAQISADEIWQPFSNSSSFRNKPKFFIFQACKGERYSQLEAPAGDLIPADTYSTPLEADMLIVFATVEGKKAWRQERNGSWFIQELCRNFNAYGRRDDAITLLLRVTKCVANSYYYQEKPEKSSTDASVVEQEEENNSNENVPVIKQMPLMVSTLTKKFYLCKSKDRNLLLEMKERQQEILNLVQKITNR